MARSRSLKKICFYLSTLRLGGAELQVLRLARFFLEQGLSVSLLVDYPEGELFPQVPQGITVHSLQWQGGLGRLRAFRDFVVKKEPDVVVAATFSCAITALASKLVWGVDTQCFVLVTGRISRENPTLWEKYFRMTPFLVKSLQRQATGFVAVSEDVARDAFAALRIPREKIEVIYNPVDIREMHRLAELQSAPHKWLGMGNSRLILSAGRLDAVKDFPTLVRAFAEVRRSKDVRLIILGEGSERERILQEASRCGVEEWVDLPGYVDNPFMFMKAADVLVVSSLSEGFSNVLIEAIALGTPVVSTDCGGPREILQEEIYGKIVPVGDSPAMAAAINRVLEERPSPVVIEARGKDFDLSVIGRKYLQYFSRPFGDSGGSDG